MSLSEELEKLARLRDRGVLTPAEFAQTKATLLAPAVAFGAGIRRQSATRIAGWPLWSIAMGADPANGEMRGHARGIVAIGDMATGVLALGGLARGVVALGGLALGLFSFGGLAIGVLLAMGGGAIGGVAVGGAAAGDVAVGGGALGRYALGGAAAGSHVISATRCDAGAVAYFDAHLGWLPPVREAMAQAARRQGATTCTR